MFISAFGGPGVSCTGSTANTVPVRYNGIKRLRKDLICPTLPYMAGTSQHVFTKKMGRNLFCLLDFLQYRRIPAVTVFCAGRHNGERGREKMI
jgi:hypothetical protein